MHVGYYSPAVDELVRRLSVGGTRPLFGAPGHNPSTRTALALATELPTTDAVVLTLGGRPYETVRKPQDPKNDDPFTEDDAWDSGEEMDKYLNGQSGYDDMTASARAVAMQPRAQRSRRASEIEIKKATTREAVERMEEAVMHLEREGSLAHRRVLAVDPVEADCAVRALAQCDVSQFVLVIGCERVVAIARRAGLPPSTPVVRSVVDPAFVLFVTGSDDQEAVAN